MQLRATFEPEFDYLYEQFKNTKYGKELLDLEGVSLDKTDVGLMSYNYFTKDVQDMTVDQNANANEDKCPNNYSAEITKGILKLEGHYLLWRYAKKRFGIHRANQMMRSLWKGDLYFHDSSGSNIQKPYCVAFSTAHIMNDGRRYGQLHSLPPKRADSFIAQVIESTMDLSQEFAGALAPADMIVNYCYYAKKENLSEYKIKNDFQKFIHVVNNKFRLGSESPFTNISLFCRENLKKVFGDYVYPDGSKPDFEYIMKVQKIFGEIMAKGDPATGLAYRFPVTTVNLMVDENNEILDKDFLEWTCSNNIDKACFNIYVNDGEKLCSCCRLTNNMEEMRKKRADTFGNGGVSIGSHRVVTINLPRIARQAQTREEFYRLLDNRLEIARDFLLVHREEILNRRIKQGFLKFFEPLKWFNQSMFFSTIGITGIYEMNKFAGFDINTKEGQEFTEEVLRYINNKADEFYEQTGWAFNVEEIPAESAAVTLAKKDKIIFGDNPFELYSNQYFPLIADVDIIDRIEVTGKFMELTSGGGILHLNIEEQITDPEKMKFLIKQCVKHGVTHFAINYGYIICKGCGEVTVGGNAKSCPKCGSKDIDYMTRVIGYYSIVSKWNPVRRNYEFPNRKFKKI